MKKPVDTRGTPPDDRMAEAMVEGSVVPQIEREEREGGEQMLTAEVVPTSGSDELTILGIRLGEVVADDPIFRHVELPEGWSRTSGNHPQGLWTYIVDEKGRQRVAMFYKAAFYDRRAECHVLGPRRDQPHD